MALVTRKGPQENYLINPNLEDGVKFGRLTEIFLALDLGEQLPSDVKPCPFYYCNLISRMIRVYNTNFPDKIKFRMLFDEIRNSRILMLNDPFSDAGELSALDELESTIFSRKLWAALTTLNYDDIEEALQGADPNRPNEKGDLPLNFAILNGCSTEIVELFLKYQADPFLEDNIGKTAFHCPKSAIFEINPVRTTLINFIINKNFTYSKALRALKFLCQGFQIQPLDYAYTYDNYDLALYLLKSDPRHKLPLLFAQMDRSPPQKREQFAKKMLLNLQLFSRWLPIHFMARTGLDDLIKLELKVRPNSINAQDYSHSETALHLAAAHRHYSAAFLLLEAGADPSICNSHGRLPPSFLANIYRTYTDPMERYVHILKIIDNRFQTAEYLALRDLVVKAIASNV